MRKRCRPIRPGEIRGCLLEEDEEGKVEGLSDPQENAEGEMEKGLSEEEKRCFSFREVCRKSESKARDFRGNYDESEEMARLRQRLPDRHRRVCSSCRLGI